MHASNKPNRPPSAAGAGQTPHDAVLRQLWDGALGRTVRCVPTRRTVSLRGPEGEAWFAKWRLGRTGDAAAEWRWLHELPRLGLDTPAPVAFVAAGRRTLLVTRGVDGVSLDVWAARARAEGWWPELVRYACHHVAPRIAALHAAGLVYRDLYWNHVFCADPRLGAAPVFLDVERVFAPRWRRRRWWIKDLAGLRASAGGASRGDALRFLRAYRAGALDGVRDWLSAIDAKAQRIRAHAPKYG